MTQSLNWHLDTLHLRWDENTHAPIFLLLHGFLQSRDLETLTVFIAPYNQTVLVFQVLTEPVSKWRNVRGHNPLVLYLTMLAGLDHPPALEFMFEICQDYYQQENGSKFFGFSD